MSLRRLGNRATILRLHDPLAGTSLTLHSLAMTSCSSATGWPLLVIATFVSGAVVGQWVFKYLCNLVFVARSKVLPAASFFVQVSKDICIVHLGSHVTALGGADIASLSL